MRISFVLFVLLLTGLSFTGTAQQQVKIITTNNRQIPMPATIIIKGKTQGVITDSSGMAIVTFPANGIYTLHISSAGFEEKKLNITIPYSHDSITITLEAKEEEMDEVIVQSTRTSRTIANVPTRVETIELEEIDEKNNMRPANVAMLLHESTGIQVQQTSATSGNSSIRIQGLDGRYTQLLKDGFPNYGNFSSGLSVLEIPPLDLKQVEIIKGPASPLFGGGAIAGVVNFISKTPKAKPEYNFIFNQSNIGQSNLGGFAAARGKKIGFTLLALYNHAKAYDVDQDEFSEVPESNEYTIHPKLFLYPNDKQTIILGNSFAQGERTGGDMYVIKGTTNADHQYLEKNKTIRNISTLEWYTQLNDRKKFSVKQSFSIFDRKIEIPAYLFAGKSYNAYTDVSYVVSGARHVIVVGANYLHDRFDEKNISVIGRDNTSATTGLYGQHTWDASDKIKLETGLRFDHVKYSNPLFSKSETFVLPRLSLLIKFNEKVSSRIGGGIGYKTPTLFTEQTETIQYQGVDQLINVRSEKSYGGTADINIRTNLAEDLVFSLNHMFFYTSIEHPLVLDNYAGSKYRFSNAVKPVHSAGFETNAKFIFKENFKLFLGYTFTDSKATYLAGNQFLPLVPRQKLNTALIYEKEDVIKLGLEGYFTGRQYLSDGTRTPSFKELGFMAEKIFNRFSLFINFENFTDTRQSLYKHVVNGSHLNPTFDEIWTHTEGFVVNGGIKLKL